MRLWGRLTFLSDLQVRLTFGQMYLPRIRLQVRLTFLSDLQVKWTFGEMSPQDQALVQDGLTFGHTFGQADLWSDITLPGSGFRSGWHLCQIYRSSGPLVRCPPRIILWFRLGWHLVTLLVRLTFGQMYPLRIRVQVRLTFGHNLGQADLLKWGATTLC